MNCAKRLPQLGTEIFLTDAGLETDLIFNKGIDLPHFAAITLLESAAGRKALQNYYQDYLALAASSKRGFILESPTWRASADWAEPLGCTPETLDRWNEQAIELMRRLRDAHARVQPVVISGCVGPRGDGYVVDARMSADEAQRYHQRQIDCFKRAGADMVTAITMTYPDEAIGIARAAARRNLPVVISFTTETDGRLPNGCMLGEGIEQVDRATAEGPAYYMINCAHPEHFEQVLDQGSRWAHRVRGIRANASRLSHAELDAAETLDSGNPHEFATLYRRLRQKHPQLTVLGGCCGTDHRHIRAVTESLSTGG